MIVAVPLAALALALAGCGGGGGGGGGETTAAPVTTTEEKPSLSKAELISQGDAICAEVNAAVGTVVASEAASSDQVSQASDLYSGMVDRLKGLGTPDETAGYNEFISAADELAQAENNARLASERGEESALATAQSEADSALASFQEAAEAYGFKDCSEAPSAPEVSAAGTGAGAEEEEAPAAPEEAAPEEAAPEEAAPEEAAPETGGAGGTAEGGGTGTGGGETGGGSSGGIGPG